MVDMDEVSIDVAAPPDELYDLVADLTNMGRWSPETYRTEWLDGATEAAVGARFKGWNQDKLGPIPLKWSTVCTITAATRGEELAFSVGESGATWTYRFAASADGTGSTVTETREEGAKPLLAKVFNAVVPRRDEKLVSGMQETLRRIKAAAESSDGGS